MSTRHTDFGSWNRWIVYSYWIFAGVCMALSLISLRLSEEGMAHDLSELLERSGIVALSCLALEVVFQLTKRYGEYVVVVEGFICAIMVTVFFHSYIPGLYISLVVPILASICYFSRKLLLFASVLTLAGFLIVFALLPDFRKQLYFYDVVSIAGMVAGVTLIGLAIISRGKDLQRSLERAIGSELDAFADTIAIENASKFDHLTGLYNHITYQEYFALLADQHVKSGLPLQLAVMDIDNYKSVNDAYGHRAGDLVLKRVADILRASISIEDVAARYGGEEFVLLLTGKTLEQTHRLMEDIRASLAETDFPELEHRSVTISIGIANFEAGMDRDALFQLADHYLYEAKRSGKNCVASPAGVGGTNL